MITVTILITIIFMTVPRDVGRNEPTLYPPWDQYNITYYVEINYTKIIYI